MNVLVADGGEVGATLARLLMEQRHQVTLIEARREQYEALRRDLPQAALVFGSGVDPALLETSGIRRADAVAAVTDSDETNLVLASLARFEYGVRRTIARINNPKNAWLFTPDMGVDGALNQAELIAGLIVASVQQTIPEAERPRA